jgi:hypothetical protein
MADWVATRGGELLHLGGGVGAKADSLFNFKAGLGSLVHEVKAIQVVHDDDSYQDLKNARVSNGGQSASDYFPEYRQAGSPTG